MKLKHNLGLAAKFAAAAIVIAGVATAGFDIKETKATASAPTGSCGLLINRNFAGYNAYMDGGSGIGSSLIGVVNFDSATASGKITLISNFGRNNAVDTEMAVPGTVTTVATDIAGTYLVTITGGSNPVPYYFTATNGGNTYLVKSKPANDSNTGAWSGVCQVL